MTSDRKRINGIPIDSRRILRRRRRLSSRNGQSRTIAHGMQFTTKDRDNDKWGAGNCAVETCIRCGCSDGWWYNNCGRKEAVDDEPHDINEELRLTLHPYTSTFFLVLKIMPARYPGASNVMTNGRSYGKPKNSDRHKFTNIEDSAKRR